MTTTNRTLSLVLICMVMLATAILLIEYRPQVAFGSSPALAPAISVATTTASFSVTSSARILSTTTNPLNPSASYTRAYATICTTSTNPVYINLDGDKPASSTAASAVIAAAAGYNACFEITDSRLVYTGSVTASSTNQTATTVFVKDYVY